MLSTFYIRNFRSILELKLDFSYAEGKAPNGYEEQEMLPFIEAGEKQRLVPCMAFFGANASGKTNVLKALEVLCHLVGVGPALAEGFEPNLLNRQFTDTCFGLGFVLNGETFEYRVVYQASEILEEALTKNGKPLYAIHRLEASFSTPITSVSYPQEKLADILRVECSDGEGRQTKLFLNRIGRNYRGLNADLANAFGFLTQSMVIWAETDAVLLPQAVDLLSQTLDIQPDEALRQITDVVRRLDIDIAGIGMVQRELGAGETEPPGITKFDPAKGTRHVFQITTTHKDASGHLTELDFVEHESAGTQRLAGLVGLVLYVLKVGGVLAVDELECSLHPLLMREIVLFFKMRRHNPKGAQLIFTTHNTDILDDSILRLSEIALVKKTAANGTLVRRLVDVKKDGDDIRNVTKFRRRYLAGFYSGVPHPAL